MRLTKPQTARMHKFIQSRLDLLNARVHYLDLEYAYEECDIASTYDIIIRERANHANKIILVHRLPLYSLRNAIVFVSKYAMIEGLINVGAD